MGTRRKRGGCYQAADQGRSKVKKLTAAMMLVGLTVACGDQLGGILAEIEELYDRAGSLLEEQMSAAEAEAVAADEDLAEAEAAFEAAPGQDPRRMWAGSFLTTPTAEDVEKRRLYDVVQALRDAKRDAERAVVRAERTIEQHRQQLQRLREAYEDDTLDLLASRLGENVSPRSMMMGLKREAEAELARLEAGESQ